MTEDKHTLEFETLSGYKLEITPLPPYYADLIDDMYPVREIPRRAIELMAGDVYYQDYEPTDEEPEEDDDDFHLWHKWHDVDKYNAKLEGIVARVKRDMLLSLCIQILDGPEYVDDTAWAEDVEAPLSEHKFKVPTEYGQRKLIFLKYVVLTDNSDIDAVLRMSMFQEVTLPGIGRALEGFRSLMGQSPSAGDHSEGR